MTTLISSSSGHDGRLNAEVTSIVKLHKHKPGALLPVLHAMQDQLGYIPPGSVAIVAEGLNLSRAEVHGVVSFYHYFRSTPAGKHTIQICRAESCQAMAGRALESHAKHTLNIDYNQTTMAGDITLEPVYCLGNCASSPAIRVDDDIFGQVDINKFDQVLAELQAADSLEPRGNGAEGNRKNNGIKPVIYVPGDTTAISLGADVVADRIRLMAHEKGLSFQIVRNGSRGLYWLEPMIEIETKSGRVAYGPVTPNDVEDFLEAECWLENKTHPLYLGLAEDIPFLKNQQRLTFSRVGIVDPRSIDDYLSSDGFAGLKLALNRSAQEIVTTVTTSGLRGRGGAAFPAGIKWQTVLDTASEQKYIVCNADEGDSGTFADRMIMESDPFSLIEGMTIAGLATGADTGFIYLREEYRLAHKVMNQAIDLALQQNYLGGDILGSGRSFTIEVRLGAGAYICGEETALLESLEGKRGMIRPKPPLPAKAGLWQKPTVINNVITLATVPFVLARGAECYRDFGVGRSRGTLPFQLAGNIKQTGLVELAFGPSLRTLLQDFGKGTRTGRPMKAIQVGGPLGAYLPESQWDTPLDYEAFSEIDAILGHGGIVVFDDSVNMGEQARYAMEFCAIESCGKCTPCRIGSTRGFELIDNIRNGNITEESRAANRQLLAELCETMVHGSLCGMGSMTPDPVMSALKYFAEDFIPSGSYSVAAEADL